MRELGEEERAAAGRVLICEKSGARAVKLLLPNSSFGESWLALFGTDYLAVKD